MEVLVPFIDLKKRFQEEKEEILTAVEKVCSEGNFVLTREVMEFEQDLTTYVGVKHAIGLNSGTDALMMALWANNIGSGDEVITSPISFIATVGAISHVGAIPKFVDIGEDQNIDPDLIEFAVSKNTKAIIPVHWGGRICDMDKILAVAAKHNLIVIEDAAQAMGSYYKGVHGGSFGHASAFSAHPLKNLNAIGDAGFMCTNNDAIAEKVMIYRNHGLASRDNCVFFGVNSRLDSLNAEILKYRLDRLSEIVNKRRKNVALYRENIVAKQIAMAPESTYEKSAYVMFIVQAENRDQLKVYLADKGIESFVYYATPLHLHKASRSLGYEKGQLPVAERHASLALALPPHQYLSEDQIGFVSEAVNEFYSN